MNKIQKETSLRFNNYWKSLYFSSNSYFKNHILIYPRSLNVRSIPTHVCCHNPTLSYPIHPTRESRTSRDVVLPQIKDWLTFLQNGTLVGTAESRRPRNRPEKGPSRGSCPPVKVSKSASSCIVPHKVSIFGVKSEEFGGEKCTFPSAKVEANWVVEKFHLQPPPPHFGGGEKWVNESEICHPPKRGGRLEQCFLVDELQWLFLQFCKCLMVCF